MRFSSGAVATIVAAAIAAGASIYVVIYQNHDRGSGISPAPASSPAQAPDVQYSGWSIKDQGHSANHSISYTKGEVGVTVAPADRSVFLTICMEQKKGYHACAVPSEKPYASGVVSFEITDNADWHFKKNSPLEFVACAYPSLTNARDKTNSIKCSDRYELNTTGGKD